tara:strand:+ start:13611 stop:14285 length:675 start_codon:yes stop_codon:yes gene_type:complete
MRTVKHKLLPKEIVLDDELYPRYSHDWQTAYDYSQSMKLGAKFPPIIVGKFKDKYYLVDGRHRYEAHKVCAGVKKFRTTKLDVVVLTPITWKQMFEEAVRRNISHGRSLSVQEKMKVAAKLKDLKYTPAKISQLVQIPQGKLKTYIGKKMVNTITGKEIVLKKPFEHLTDIQATEIDVEELQESFGGASQLVLLQNVITLLKTGTINKKDKQVKQKLRELKELL